MVMDVTVEVGSNVRWQSADVELVHDLCRLQESDVRKCQGS